APNGPAPERCRVPESSPRPPRVRERSECAASPAWRLGEPASLHRDAARAALRLRCWNGAKSFLFNCLPGRYGVGARPAPEHREATESRFMAKQKLERARPN